MVTRVNEQIDWLIDYLVPKETERKRDGKDRDSYIFVDIKGSWKETERGREREREGEREKKRERERERREEREREREREIKGELFKYAENWID